jgi:hypothetical protein
MATALQDYALLKSAMNGDAMVQVKGIRHNTEGNHQPVELLESGLAGFTPGSPTVEIQIDYAIPIGGPEENFQAMCVNGDYVDMQIFQGRLQWSGRGKIMSNQVTSQQGQSTEGTFTFRGPPVAFE